MLLLDVVYGINKHLVNRNTIWDKLLIKRLFSLVVRVLTNYILPLFLIRSSESLYNGCCVPIIVSITSFPARINRVYMTIESVICQSDKPQAIILWLSRQQFPNEINDLPKRLVLQQERGLSIRFVDGDIKSYKKFYYSFLEFKNSLILTLDDDLLIPSYFLKSIYTCKKQHPNNVIASFGFRFYWDDDINYIKPTNTRIVSGDSGNDLMFGSGGGTLFDSSVVSRMDTIDKIIELCPTADDIYLNALFRVCGFGVTFHCNNPLLSIKIHKNQSLLSINGDIFSSDSSNALQLKKLVEYFTQKYGYNPFRVIRYEH